MDDKNDAKLDPYLTPTDSPFYNHLPDKQIPWVLGNRQNLQMKRPKFAQIAIKKFILPSNSATLTGTVGAGSTQIITNSLTFNAPLPLDQNFAIPYVNIYQGTAIDQNYQIFPGLGGSLSYGSWSIQWGFDKYRYLNDTPGTAESVISYQIHNNMGVAGTYFYTSIWKYIMFNNTLAS